MSYTKQRKYGLGDFFSNYMGNFGKLLIVNIMFCVPLAIFCGILVIIMMTRGVNIFEIFLLIPLMSPFFAGLINVCRKLTADGEFRTVKDFFEGIRDNWKFFAVNSVFLYILSVSIWASVNYFANNESNLQTVSYLVVMIITSVLFIFAELSAVVMAVSVELKAVEIVKNSFIMVLGGFTNHLKTFMSLLFTASLIYSVAALTGNAVVSFSIICVLTVTIIPALIIYIIVYNSYQNIERIVIDPYLKNQKEEKLTQIQKEQEDKLTVEDLEPLSKGDPEEYVFFNGKTVKRKNIIKMIEVRKSKGEN